MIIKMSRSENEASCLHLLNDFEYRVNNIKCDLLKIEGTTSQLLVDVQRTNYGN